jgi:glycosyltransferase involved in cell wall biosynthesis
MQSPTISVIIPAYNHGAFVARGITSVLSQTFKAHEIIVVDDGSTDDTKRRLSEYSCCIRYHYQSNCGPGAAKQAGVGLAQGEYIQFLDADDSIAPNKFEKQLAIFKANPDTSLVYSDYANIDSQRNLLGGESTSLSSGEAPLARLVKENFMPVHAPLTRRQAIIEVGGLDTARIGQEDWDLWLRLAIKGYRFYHSPGIMAYYHRDGSAVTTNAELMYQRSLHMLNKFTGDEQLFKIGEGYLNQFRFYQNLQLATRSYNNRQWDRASGHLLAAIKAARGQERWALLKLLSKTKIHQALNCNGAIQRGVAIAQFLAR